MTWEQGRATIEQLLQRGDLETVAPQPEFAEATLTLCDTHIAAARTIAHDDPVGALALAYDAARKALTCLLLAQGIRPTRSGGHIAPSVDTPPAMIDDAADAIAVAEEAVNAARLVLPHVTPF